jgi:hypothetical protein
VSRKGRIQLVGKIAEREAEALADELAELERELHREWRRNGVWPPRTTARAVADESGPEHG